MPGAAGFDVEHVAELFPLDLDLYLYLDLDLDLDLRISQAPAGVRADAGIGVGDLIARIRARFPGLDVLADSTYVELEEALAQTDFPLTYDHQRKRFMPRVRETDGSRYEPSVSMLTSTGTLIAAAQSELAVGNDPRRIMTARLQAARRRGGFLALTVKASELPGVAERLAERSDVVPVSLDDLFLTALRELAAENGVEWQALLRADAAFATSGTLGAGLASYARAATERVAERAVALAEQSGPRTVLFAHEAALTARYWAAGGRELLVALQAGVTHSSSTPWRALCRWAAAALSQTAVSGTAPVVTAMRTTPVVDGDTWTMLPSLELRATIERPAAPDETRMVHPAVSKKSRARAITTAVSSVVSGRVDQK
ncbi:hypothetical protein [Streptomyces sp. WG5]|uniref:hypothetical protein n=1 Tax=Streptomyces sp. WG5 TaxID=3417648 RepID=UPI003CEAAA7F